MPSGFILTIIFMSDRDSLLRDLELLEKSQNPSKSLLHVGFNQRRKPKPTKLKLPSSDLKALVKA